MTKHATLGASSAHRWMECAGSVRLARDVPDFSSSYADEGTAAHEIAARALEKGVDADLWLDTVVQTDGMREPVTVDEEMVEAAQVYVDYCRRRMNEAAQAEGMQSWIETRFDLAPINPPGPMFGTADFALWSPPQKPRKVMDRGTPVLTMPKPSLLEVVDYKHGSGVLVEAEGNPQLMYYALGAVVELKVKPDKIRVTVVQPRANHPDGIVRSWDFEWADLVEFRRELFERAVATQADDAPLTVGDHCRFCPAQAICPAQQALAEETAQEEFGALVVAEESPLVSPEALTLDQLLRAMEAAPLIEAWLSSVRKHVRHLTESGEETGFKLVAGRAMRRWVDEDQAEAWLEPVLADDAYKKKLLSVAQAEKALKAIGMKLPDGIFNKVSNTQKLVPLDDPRPALPPPVAAEDEFEAGGLTEVLEASIEMTAPEPEEDEYVPDTSAVTDEEIAGLEELDPEWVIKAPGMEPFTVKAPNEAAARRAAREMHGWSRLPNHTTVSGK